MPSCDGRRPNVDRVVFRVSPAPLGSSRPCIRNTPASDVIALLLERAATVTYHDPYVPEVRVARGNVHRLVQLESLLDECQHVVVVTPYGCLDWEYIYEHAKLVVDTCNSSRGNVCAQHIRFFALGLAGLLLTGSQPRHLLWWRRRASDARLIHKCRDS